MTSLVIILYLIFIYILIYLNCINIALTKCNKTKDNNN